MEILNLSIAVFSFAKARKLDEEEGWYGLGEPGVPNTTVAEEARAAYEDALIQAAYEDAVIQEVAAHARHEDDEADEGSSIPDVRGGCGCARAAAKPVAGGCGQVRAGAKRATSCLDLRNFSSRARTRRSAAASQKPKSMRRLRTSGGHGWAKGVRRRTSGTTHGRGRGGRR